MSSKRIVIIAVAVIVLLGVAVVWTVLRQPSGHGTYELTDGLKIETWQNNNGSRVMYVPAPQLPMVDVRVVFDAGSARDAGKAGVAFMTNHLLENGAGTWNTEQVIERFDDVGAQFHTDSLRDMAYVHVRSLSDASLLSQAVETMATVIKDPKFPQDEFERERQRLLVALRNQQESPDDLAELAFYNAIFEQHPYASPVKGTEASVAALTRQDIDNFYKRYYVGRNAIVIIVGAVNRGQAEHIAELVVGGLPAGEAPEAIAEVPPLQASKEIKQQHPSAQTHLWVGQPGMVRNDEDYFPLYVGNHILGGSGFGSRVMQEIREKKGLAYSSYSYFIPMRRKGPFLMALQTKNDQAQQALALLQQTVKTFIQDGPSEEELKHAKQNITGSFPLRLDSNKDIVEQLAVLGFYNLPLDYLKTFNSKVEAVTRAQIIEAFQRRIHPDKLATVMVGNLDAVDKK